MPAVATMWRVVIAATADPKHRDRLLGVVQEAFGVD
jgi:hypothetical protein